MIDERVAIVARRGDAIPTRASVPSTVISSVAAILGGGAGALASWAAGFATGATIVAVVGLLANVVMACAAVGAFFLWRRQAVASSRVSKEHDVAMRLMDAAYGLENSVKESLYPAGGYAHITSHCDLELTEEVWESWAEAMSSHSDALQERLKEWSAFKPAVQAIWNRDTASRLEPLRLLAYDWCMALALAGKHRKVSYDGEREDEGRSWRWAAVFEEDRAAVTAFVTALESEVDTLAAWAGEHTGRPFH